MKLRFIERQAFKGARAGRGVESDAAPIIRDFLAGDKDHAVIELDADEDKKAVKIKLKGYVTRHEVTGVKVVTDKDGKLCLCRLTSEGDKEAAQ